VRHLASWINRTSLAVGLPLLAACSTMHPVPGVMGTTDNLVHEGAAPHISLLERPMRADGVVDATFQLDAPGYAMVIALDRDNRIHVVYPETPAADGLVQANESRDITPFFAGRGTGSARSAYWDDGYYFGRGYPFSPYRSTLTSFQPGLSRARGTVYLVAIVSAQPLHFDEIRDARGGWEVGALHSAVFDPDVSFVGARVGRLVVLPGQAFTTDYRVIADERASPLYVSTGYSQCGRAVYGTGYYGRPIFGFDPYLSGSSLYLASAGDGFRGVGAYPTNVACRPAYLWTEQGERIRRPSPLFPNDTSLLFTTRRISARRPGVASSGAPFLPAVAGDGRAVGPELLRGRIEVRTAEHPPARAAASAHDDSHGEGERIASTSAPARAGRLH
jgi:hypothetical protein